MLKCVSGLRVFNFMDDIPVVSDKDQIAVIAVEKQLVFGELTDGTNALTQEKH